MRITMQKAESLTLEQMREFLAASEELDLALARRTEIYDLVERTLRKQRYLELTKKDKGVVRRYLAKLSGRSLPQITRLIRQYRQSGAVRVSQPRRRRFPTRYTADDIALLAAVDAAHEGLSGPTAADFAETARKAQAAYAAAQREWQIGLAELAVEQRPEFEAIAKAQRDLQVAYLERGTSKFEYLMAEDPSRIVLTEGLSQFINRGMHFTPDYPTSCGWPVRLPRRCWTISE